MQLLFKHNITGILNFANLSFFRTENNVLKTIFFSVRRNKIKELTQF